MKTPRDILFARHQAVAPKLDAMRQSTVAAVCDRRAPTDGKLERRSQTVATVARLMSWCLGCSNKLWLELVWPCRRIWTGLATVWLLILIVNFSQRDNVSSVTGKPVRAGEMTMSLQVQQRWMNELFTDRSSPPDADRPRNFTPGPRTEASETAAV